MRRFLITLLPLMLPVCALAGSIGGPEKDGVRIACELPNEWHIRNRGGSDGSGLCVFASCSHAGRWQNEPVFAGLFEWMWRYPGGSWPQKTQQKIEQLAKEKGLPAPDYLQVEDADLELLKAACRSGRMPGVTYCTSATGRYGGRRIAHMVSLVHADDRHFVVLDNNFPGENQYEWLSPDEFRRTYMCNGKAGWSVVLLSPPPPPALWN